VAPSHRSAPVTATGALTDTVTAPAAASGPAPATHNFDHPTRICASRDDDPGKSPQGDTATDQPK